MFREYDTGGKESIHLSGRYLVTKVARTVSANTMLTTIVCCREAVNEMKGDFLDRSSTYVNALSLINMSGLFPSQIALYSRILNASRSLTDINDIHYLINSIPGTSSVSDKINKVNEYYDKLNYYTAGALDTELMALSEYLPSVESLANAIGLTELQETIDDFLSFDIGSLLDLSILSNMSDIMGSGASISNVMELGQKVIAQMGFDIGSITSIDIPYRGPGSAILKTLLQRIVNYKVKIPGITR